MRSLVYLLIAFTLVTGLSFAGERQHDAGGNAEYFPPGAFHSDHEELDTVARGWYSKILMLLEEPSLLEMPVYDEFPVLRFINIPTWSPPAAFRVYANGGAHFLAVKFADGQGGYDPGKLAIDRVIELSAETFEALQAAFRAAPVCGAAPDVTLGFDGSEWIFEISGADGYCVTDRWSPMSGPYHDLGQMVMKIAGSRWP
jgi:hypothetical protein